MKALRKISLVFSISVMLNSFIFSSDTEVNADSLKNRLNVNNISACFYISGIFDQDLRTQYSLGFEWPKGSGKSAVFSAGLTLAAYLNNELRMACASYRGEYAPGYIRYFNGNSVACTNDKFRIYKITRGDNINNNPDWINWSNMVPFGAPFIDVNHNGIYEPAIDTPGVKYADQTIFICLTDGFPDEHKIGEGFGGGTQPMFAEVHLTAWAYNKPGLEDMQFIKWDIINKSLRTWTNACYAIVCDPDLGNRNDDYIGCDTIRQLGYCYNANNIDSIYGVNPPAVGFLWLNCNSENNLGLKSFTYFHGLTICENINGEQIPAYYMLKGLKGDQTPWVIPPGGNQQYITKFCYSGDPESGAGWTEYTGRIKNCGGLLTGEFEHPTIPGDRRIIMSSGGNGFNVPSNDTHTVIIAQLIARGTSNKNSVTKLKQLSDVARQLCNNGFVIGVNNITSTIPNSFVLYQNHPNPFNPATRIKFDIPPSKGARGMTRLVIYDVLGKEVAILVNENLKPGSYEASWDGTNYPSGVYFYKLITDIYSETKKMVLIK
jgi:hypothetical protein